jgi:hypothetical protein
MFWDIPLDSGKYAVGVILQKEPKSRARFLAGLLDWTGDHIPTPESIHTSALIKQGRVHVKTVRETGGMIRGFIPLSDLGIAPFMEKDYDSIKSPIYQGYNIVYTKLSDEKISNLKVLGVWGYRMIKHYAEKITSG